MDTDQSHEVTLESARVVNLLDIQPLVPDLPPSKVYAPKVIDMPSVDIQLVLDDLSKDVCRVPYMDFLLKQVLPKDHKLQDKIHHEVWQFKVINDPVGSPQLYKKTTKFIPLYRCVSK